MSPPQELQHLPIDMIEPNLEQPRQYFDEAKLQALAASVRERGILQPVLVRPLQDGKYQLVAGERRWCAAKIAGLQRIPALISTYDDLAALEVGLIENMAREDLNPIEEARACATLVQELGLTYRQLGKRAGRSEATMWNLVHLLELSEEILELLERGELSKSHGSALLLAGDPQVRSRLAREAIEQGWSTRTLEARARESNMSGPELKEGSEGVGLEGGRERVRDAGQAQERDADLQQGLTVMDVARVWGDLLGVEVGVRTLRGRQLRVEFVFSSPEVALAVGVHLAEAVARGKKRR
jgi:ParB family transcriptional regulator, chromosome partitioning protein